MPKVNVTCRCGSTMQYESQWTMDVSTAMQAFYEAHAVCRHPTLFASDAVTGTTVSGTTTIATVLEEVTHARNSLVGCYMTCEKCGEEEDCSDMDAVGFIDNAIAMLKGTPS